MKRSRHVALLVMGTLAVGGGAYALMPAENCTPNSPAMTGPSVPQNVTGCARGGGGHGGSWSHGNFFGGSANSSSSTSSGTAETTRGGFGSFARSFAAHFSGG
ncbi:MAG TPA: hypothetical protein VKT76_11605 [Bradyrhizobium sp.]|nr:hypothetical protein [Bradyrhizobium sp.]